MTCKLLACRRGDLLLAQKLGSVRRNLHVPAARLDYRYIRDNESAVIKNCKQRNLRIGQAEVSEVVEHYKTLTNAITELNQLLSKRNEISASIKAAGKGDKTELLEQAALLKPRIQALEEDKQRTESTLLKLAYPIPNTTHPATPIGNESKCKIVSYINEENQYTSDKALDHVHLAQQYDLIDFEAAARVSGTGFYYLKNEAVILELALTQFALRKARDAGFSMVRCPDLVRSEFVPACGFQPRDAEGQQVYETSNGDLSLVGTAEIPLAGLGVDKVYAEHDLPKRYVAVGRAFRAEAGARGADTRGLFRVHEFTKVELFTVCTAEQSEHELQAILDLQKSIVSDLQLCARLLEMPSEELGASAHRKFDIEAWIPSRNDWGEITSASNCTDYQARRLNIRYKRTKNPHDTEQGPNTLFAHTLNGTAAAIPRLIVAGLESWFSHGRIKIPKCLHPYTGGMTEIGTRDPPLP